MASGAGDRRLSTWAEIAAYIGRDVRTARRYESERGLPVRRLPGARSTVYALTRDLDAWRAGGAPEAEEARTLDAPAPVPPPAAGPGPAAHPLAPGAEPRSVRSKIATGGALLAMLALAASGAAGWKALRLGAARPGSAEARVLTDEGVYAWNLRTPQGISTAVDRFTQAVVRDPEYAPAYAGLADAYNLAPEFTGMRPQDAYPRAKAAAERAVALDPRSADAHRALAFETFWWERDAARARREFETSLSLDHRPAITHLWYANMLAAELDPRALDEVRRALRLEPASTAARSDEGWILYMLGRPREALATLNVVAAADPNYSALYRYRALAELAVGDDLGMLKDLRREGELTQEPVLVRLASAGLAASPRGRRAIYEALCIEGEKAYADGRFSPSRLASFEMIRGDSTRALALLRAVKSNRQWYVSAIADPIFTPLRRELSASN